MKELFYFEELLGINFSDFIEKEKKELEKNYHRNEESHSVFINNNEYMFLNDELHSIEINNYEKKFKNLEKALCEFEESKCNWEIFQKYTYGKNLVVKVNQYIYFEYSFDTKKFSLDVIRVSDNE